MQQQGSFCWPSFAPKTNKLLSFPSQLGRSNKNSSWNIAPCVSVCVCKTTEWLLFRGYIKESIAELQPSALVSRLYIWKPRASGLGLCPGSLLAMWNSLPQLTSHHLCVVETVYFPFTFFFHKTWCKKHRAINKNSTSYSQSLKIWPFHTWHIRPVYNTGNTELVHVVTD